MKNCLKRKVDLYVRNLWTAHVSRLYLGVFLSRNKCIIPYSSDCRKSKELLNLLCPARGMLLREDFSFHSLSFSRFSSSFLVQFFYSVLLSYPGVGSSLGRFWGHHFFCFLSKRERRISSSSFFFIAPRYRNGGGLSRRRRKRKGRESRCDHRPARGRRCVS